MNLTATETDYLRRARAYGRQVETCARSLTVHGIQPQQLDRLVCDVRLIWVADPHSLEMVIEWAPVGLIAATLCYAIDQQKEMLRLAEAAREPPPGG